MDEQLNNEEIKEESKFEPLFSLSEPEIDWHEKYLYLAADMENTRKRFNKQLNNAIEYGKEDIFLDIINEIDTLLLNERHTDNEVERTLLNKIITSFYTMLKKYGVEPMYDLLEHRDIYFNPRTDNAVTSIPTNDKMLDNSIADVIKRGYMYKDKVLRYEDVIIYKFEE